jgi:hypothetical protein
VEEEENQIFMLIFSIFIADFICADISLSSLGKNSFNTYAESHSKWNLVSNVTTQIGTHAYLPCKVRSVVCSCYVRQQFNVLQIYAIHSPQRKMEEMKRKQSAISISFAVDVLFERKAGFLLLFMLYLKRTHTFHTIYMAHQKSQQIKID